ncbi:N-acetyltransferase [Sphaerisporangium aureirubrum]|uniref:N-acetyltransferase n=1 Tax=Sphaerisporangium aureirubrum TaxID=1544736 RepID=A0ABW1NLK8_9ACTN
MDVEVVNVADRPDLSDELWTFSGGWPDFMLEDQMGNMMGALPRHFPRLQLLALAGADQAVAAKAHAVPFPWTGTPDELPERGWDEVLGMGLRAGMYGRETHAVSALEISIRPHLRGTGLSSVMLAALRDAAAKEGYADLFAPVRPNGKPAEPHAAMTEYALRTRPDGLPVDPWLRVHVRAGGRILRVCPASMTIAGSLAQWRDWTGLPFDADGEVVVPGALVPVRVSVRHDHAVYVEPNVWVHHSL